MVDRAPVRLVHLGLGAFHRAHQAWYTHRANQLADTQPYGIWAFTGRSPQAAEMLARQGCRYTLIERGPDSDRPETIEAIVRASDGADRDSWQAAMSAEQVTALTLTITEAGYTVDADDLDRLREGAPARSAPGRIVDGLRSRMRAGSGPLAVISCDNLSGNGQITHELVSSLAGQLDPTLQQWIETEVSFPSTMVDRITPATTPEDRDTAEQLAGWPDQAPVVAEPFSEWVISGMRPDSAPAWDRVGAQVVDDVEPYEQRKLWLLNGGHSLLAYLGLCRDHATIAETMADPICSEMLAALWSEAAEVLPFDPPELAAATAALRDRFNNARIQHRLSQIATDGFHKLPRRIVDMQRVRRLRGLPLGTGGATALAAWAVHLDQGQTTDPAAARVIEKVQSASTPTDKVRVVVAAAAPEFSDDPEMIELVSDQFDLITRPSRKGPT